MSHDCVPNTNHTDEENNYKLTVRASTRIPQSHPITLSYAYTLQVCRNFSNHIYGGMKNSLIQIIIRITFWIKIFLVSKPQYVCPSEHAKKT